MTKKYDIGLHNGRQIANFGGMIYRVFHIAAEGMAVIAAALMMSTSASSSDTHFAGKDGREIAATIAREYRPLRYAANQSEMEEAARSCARNPDGKYRDYFSTKSAVDPLKLSLQHVAPVHWWTGNASPADTDIHNIVLGNYEAIAPRSDLPPGHVVTPDYDNGYWRAGIGTISGMETKFFEPADELKGDFARIFMYMGVIYSCEVWAGRSIMLYTDGGYPYLTAYGRETLLKWHRNDPVDEAELQRDSEIAAFQGLGNPFVAEASLAEYIWGIHSGETYPDDEEQEPNPDPTPDPVEDPDNDYEPSTLKGTYSLSTDKRIDLRSPYVGANARWTINGKDIDGLSINLSDIPSGRYELAYRSRSSVGKIIITITP